MLQEKNNKFDIAYFIYIFILIFLGGRERWRKPNKGKKARPSIVSQYRQKPGVTM